MKTFGRRMKFARTKFRLSVVSIAKKFNLSRQSVYNYEKETKLPQLDVAVNIARELGFSLDGLRYD